MLAELGPGGSCLRHGVGSQLATAPAGRGRSVLPLVGYSRNSWTRT